MNVPIGRKPTLRLTKSGSPSGFFRPKADRRIPSTDDRAQTGRLVIGVVSSTESKDQLLRAFLQAMLLVLETPGSTDGIHDGAIQYIEILSLRP